MNQKEIAELRRRWTPDKNAVSRIYGCFVNSGKQIVSDIDESLGMLTQEEGELYLGLLKKAMSGKPGKNLIDIVFSNQQVMDSEEHRLLSALRSSELKDSAARQCFYQKVIDSLDMGDSNYLILLAHDTYDVPYRGKDGENDADAGDTVFSYIVCAVCPVKADKLRLGYFPGDNEFHSAVGQTVAAPELGFVFPAFDDRCANIYNALLYSRKADELPQDFIDAVFHTEPPMSAGEQQEVFQSALTEALGEECTVETVQAVLEQLSGRIEEHREQKNPETLTLTQKELTGILRDCGVSEQAADAFHESCAEQYGERAVIAPANLVNGGQYTVKTERATVSLPVDSGCFVETRIIDGKKYILIPADGELEINGIQVK